MSESLSSKSQWSGVEGKVQKETSGLEGILFHHWSSAMKST